MKVSDEELERLSTKESIRVIRRLEAKIDVLVAEARERMKANAAFSKGTSKANPKKPGRKAGEGLSTNRPEPTPRAGD